MKTLNEYKREYEQAEKNYKTLKEKTQAADEAIREKWSGLPVISIIKNEEYKRECNESDALLAAATTAKAIAIICKENLRHAKADELIKKIPGILNKYVGKRAGEKTRDKIRKDFISCLWYSGYMKFDCNGDARYLEFSPLDGNGYYAGTYKDNIEIGMRDYSKKMVDGSTNIIQEISADDLRVCGVFDYIDDPAAYVQEADDLRIRYEQKRKEFEELEREYKRKIAIFERR